MRQIYIRMLGQIVVKAGPVARFVSHILAVGTDGQQSLQGADLLARRTQRLVDFTFARKAEERCVVRSTRKPFCDQRQHCCAGKQKQDAPPIASSQGARSISTAAEDKTSTAHSTLIRKLVGTSKQSAMTTRMSA